MHLGRLEPITARFMSCAPIDAGDAGEGPVDAGEDARAITDGGVLSDGGTLVDAGVGPGLVYVAAEDASGAPPEARESAARLQVTSVP